MNIFKEIYNALKVYCFNTNSACWEVGVIKFYKDEADNFDTSCSFEIMSKYDKEPLGYCSIFLTTKPMEGSLVVVFNTYKVNTNDVVYPSITLPPSRCEYDNDILGHYFYLLVDQLYHMTAFLSRISKIFLADGEIIVYNISIPRGKGKHMKRNDYVQYLNPYTRKFIICQIEEIYGDGHVLLYAVDTNEAFLVNTWELLSY